MLADVHSGSPLKQQIDNDSCSRSYFFLPLLIYLFFDFVLLFVLVYAIWGFSPGGDWFARISESLIDPISSLQDFRAYLRGDWISRLFLDPTSVRYRSISTSRLGINIANNAHKHKQEGFENLYMRCMRWSVIRNVLCCGLMHLPPGSWLVDSSRCLDVYRWWEKIEVMFDVTLRSSSAL